MFLYQRVFIPTTVSEQADTSRLNDLEYIFLTIPDK